MNTNGYAEIIGFTPATEPNKREIYLNYLSNLSDQGIMSPLLWTGPDNNDFTGSVMDIYRKSELQHCVKQKIFTLLKYVKDPDKDLFQYGLQHVFRQKEIKSFLHEMNAFRSIWSQQYSDLMDSLEEKSTFLMTFFKFPELLHPYIKSSSLLLGTIRSIYDLEIDPTLSFKKLEQKLIPLCQDANDQFRKNMIDAFIRTTDETEFIYKTKYHLARV